MQKRVTAAVGVAVVSRWPEVVRCNSKGFERLEKAHVAIDKRSNHSEVVAPAHTATSLVPLAYTRPTPTAVN